MKVRFSAKARARIAVVDRFWREQRLAAPNLFDEELKAAAEALRDGTAVGVVFRRRSRSVVYRLLLPKTQQFVYYTVRGNAEVFILTVWGARRRPGPSL